MHLDRLVPHANSVVVPENHSSALQAHKDDHLASMLRTAVEGASNDDGWARLCRVGQMLTKRYPDFDSRTYGYHKLSDLITASSLFETSRRSFRKGSPPDIIVRDIRRKPKCPAK